MSDFSDRKVIIVGAGLGGALLANFLGRTGARVEVYERRADPRTAGFVGGRSINLAISARGIDALERVGLADEIMPQAIPMRGRMIHAPDGRLTFQPYDRDPSRHINSMSRGGLNLALVQAAERHENVRVHFGCRCVEVDFERTAATFERVPDGGNGGAGGAGAGETSAGETGAGETSAGETGAGETNSGAGARTGASAAAGRAAACAAAVAVDTFRDEADLIIGADGAFSAVRGAMQKLEGFDYSQSYLAHGYKELHIPPAADGGFQMEPHALHIWPRRAFMMIALPNPDGSFTCTCFWPLRGPASFANLRGPEQIRSYFERVFPDAVPRMPTLVEDYQRNPTSTLVTIRCAPWNHRRVALLGDAAHAIVPFYGQGMNAAFEDCVALDRCLRAQPDDWPAALERYARERKPQGDTIAALALQNFIEMRDLTAKRWFRIRKAVERGLHRFWPGYVPLYTMVSFTTIPYAEAAARDRRQGRVVLGTAALVLALVIALVVALIA